MKRWTGMWLGIFAIFAAGCSTEPNEADSPLDTETETQTDDDTETESLEPITCEGYNEADFPEVAVEFEVDETTALMWGYVDHTTPDLLETLIEDNPDLETLIMPFVPGSVDDESNLEASRIVREAGLATCVPSTGLIASGGVDFFVAGLRRSAASGALIGVHSWATGSGMEGNDFPEDSPVHQMYLQYYEEMGIPAEFYWFTLEAAPAAGVHWMTDNEIFEYELLTE